MNIGEDEARNVVDKMLALNLIDASKEGEFAVEKKALANFLADAAKKMRQKVGFALVQPQMEPCDDARDGRYKWCSDAVAAACQ